MHKSMMIQSSWPRSLVPGNDLALAFLHLHHLAELSGLARLAFADDPGLRLEHPIEYPARVCFTISFTCRLWSPVARSVRPIASAGVVIHFPRPELRSITMVGSDQ